MNHSNNIRRGQLTLQKGGRPGDQARARSQAGVVVLAGDWRRQHPFINAHSGSAEELVEVLLGDFLEVLHVGAVCHTHQRMACALTGHDTHRTSMVRSLRKSQCASLSTAVVCESALLAQ